MSSKDRLKIAMDVIRVILGNDRQTMGELGLQLIQLSAGFRKRLSSGKRSPKKGA